MPSPIRPEDFCNAVPSANADFCERFTKWLSVPQMLCDLFNWMLNPDGSVASEFQQEVATYSAPTGTVIYCLTQNVGDGWLLADGREISRTVYVGLFQAIGTRYGDGNGSTTFNLPDLRGRSMIGAGAGVANTDFDTPNLTNRNIDDAYVGEEDHELTELENAEHKHLSGLLFRLGLTPNNTSAILRDQDDLSMSLYGSEAATVGTGTYLVGEGSSGAREEIYGGPSGAGAPHNTIHPCVIGFPFVKT